MAQQPPSDYQVVVLLQLERVFVNHLVQQLELAQSKTLVLPFILPRYVCRQGYYQSLRLPTQFYVAHVYGEQKVTECSYQHILLVYLVLVRYHELEHLSHQPTEYCIHQLMKLAGL